MVSSAGRAISSLWSLPMLVRAQAELVWFGDDGLCTCASGWSASVSATGEGREKGNLPPRGCVLQSLGRTVAGTEESLDMPSGYLPCLCCVAGCVTACSGVFEPCGI